MLGNRVDSVSRGNVERRTERLRHATLSTPKYSAYTEAGWDWTKRPHITGLLHGDTLAVEVHPGTARECHG